MEHIPHECASFILHLAGILIGHALYFHYFPITLMFALIYYMLNGILRTAISSLTGAVVNLLPLN